MGNVTSSIAVGVPASLALVRLEALIEAVDALRRGDERPWIDRRDAAPSRPLGTSQPSPQASVGPRDAADSPEEMKPALSLVLHDRKKPEEEPSPFAIDTTAQDATVGVENANPTCALVLHRQQRRQEESSTPADLPGQITGEVQKLEVADAKPASGPDNQQRFFFFLKHSRRSVTQAFNYPAEFSLAGKAPAVRASPKPASNLPGAKEDTAGKPPETRTTKAPVKSEKPVVAYPYGKKSTAAKLSAASVTQAQVKPEDDVPHEEKSAAAGPAEGSAPQAQIKPVEDIAQEKKPAAAKSSEVSVTKALTKPAADIPHDKKADTPHGKKPTDTKTTKIDSNATKTSGTKSPAKPAAELSREKKLADPKATKASGKNSSTKSVVELPREKKTTDLKATRASDNVTKSSPKLATDRPREKNPTSAKSTKAPATKSKSPADLRKKKSKSAKFPKASDMQAQSQPVEASHCAKEFTFTAPAGAPLMPSEGPPEQPRDGKQPPTQTSAQSRPFNSLENDRNTETRKPLHAVVNSRSNKLKRSFPFHSVRGLPRPKMVKRGRSGRARSSAKRSREMESHEGDTSALQGLGQLAILSDRLKITDLPVDILMKLPSYLHSLKDLQALSSTCRILRSTVGNPSPPVIHRMTMDPFEIVEWSTFIAYVDDEFQVFGADGLRFLAVKSKALGIWASENATNASKLADAVRLGPLGLYHLALRVTGFLTYDELKSFGRIRGETLRPFLAHWAAEERAYDLVYFQSILTPAERDPAKRPEEYHPSSFNPLNEPVLIHYWIFCNLFRSVLVPVPDPATPPILESTMRKYMQCCVAYNSDTPGHRVLWLGLRGHYHLATFIDRTINKYRRSRLQSTLLAALIDYTAAEDRAFSILKALGLRTLDAMLRKPANLMTEIRSLTRKTMEVQVRFPWDGLYYAAVREAHERSFQAWIESQF